VEVNTQSQPDVAVNTLIVINVLVIFVVQSAEQSKSGNQQDVEVNTQS